MRKESWQAAKEAQKEGLVRSIGVSNYGVKHLEELISDEVLPSINQVGLDDFFFLFRTSSRAF